MQIQKEKHALGACSRGRAFLLDLYGDSRT